VLAEIRVRGIAGGDDSAFASVAPVVTREPAHARNVQPAVSVGAPVKTSGGYAKYFVITYAGTEQRTFIGRA